MANLSCLDPAERDWGYLGEVAFGKPGRLLAQVSLLGELGAYIMSFLCVLGVHVNLLLPAVTVQQGVLASTAMSLLLSYAPLRYLNRISLTAHLAYGGAIACLFATVYADLQQPQAPDLASLAANNMGLAKEWGLPHLPEVALVLVYSWAGHSMVPTIANTLARPADVQRVIKISYAVAVAVAFFIGLSGFLAFGQHTSQVFTANLSMSYWTNSQGEAVPGLSALRWIGQVSVALKLTFTIPCWLHTLLGAVLPCKKGGRIVDAGMRLLIVFTLGAIALVFGDQVSIVVAFAGATFGNIMAIILPCIVYYGIKRRIQGRVGGVQTVGLVLLAVIGCCFGVYGMQTSLRQLSEASASASGR